MKNLKVKALIIGSVVLVLLAAIYYYVALPAINIHSSGFWKFILFILAAATVLFVFFHAKIQPKNEVIRNKGVRSFALEFKNPKDRVIFRLMMGVVIGAVAIFLIGSLLSSEIINASKYQSLLTVETRNFKEDIKEVSYNQIPILDKESAATIGNRVMGTMVDIVSQFEISDMYAQINYKNKPVRVSPLKYGSLIKWFTNQSSGLPGYVRIDMTTQQAEIVRLSEGIKYSTSDHFGRNIYRHLRFAYPTYIFDTISFEIDEEGTPYWICPTKKYNIGLFGGVTVGRVVLCNAITGEMTDYDVTKVPQWVDKVYSAELLIELYDYYGTLKHGYFNSILSQKDCLKTTDGYNYMAMNDDVWVYTGVTSVGQDESNVGFVLMNQRTMETRYYTVAGAEEFSAMSSAQGKVQHLNYKATFPLLLNVGGEPTYFMALKDSAGLVKSYAMLNIEKYQTVAIGDTVNECEKNYINMLKNNGITVEDKKEELQIVGTVTKIVPTVIDGNSHYYILLDNKNEIYDVSVKENPSVILVEQGNKVTLTYTKAEGVNTNTANIKKIDN
ncbi:MAG: CvpA family protein [Lachnospira sp.]|jgi:hypothetical protein|nr:CvpA family protein [Lachnospira sp.]